jgi:phage shock protein PspC (stress-responsive transcriptional regulator)
MNTTTTNPEPVDDATTNAEGANDTATNPEFGNQGGPQPLCRPIQNRMLAGVAAGVASYLGVDVTVVRIVLAVLAVVGGAGVPIYLAGWLLIPEEGAEQSIASEFIQSMPARLHAKSH